MTDVVDISRYVYNGVEVVLTGRSAERNTKPKTTTRKRAQPREDVLHEVTPADKDLGSWKKWVRMEELYKIQIKNEHVNNTEETDDE